MSRRKNNGKPPMRRCIGCMESKPKQEMIRIAWFQEKLSVDRTGKANGRGVYLCDDRACIEQARRKKALSRSFRTNFSAEETDPIFEELLHDK
ncbi:RNase P modulator RnpM [Eubacterium sp. AB3007]|uniref:RNase P modulator RnpM n=1 Tax=Eubacterium sp. AB3007 TaxID=1392487 RepID=UPI000484C54F|nr:YlxR family protein [Eubacterium sp. AB3007]